MGEEKYKLTFSFISKKGKERNNNTDVVIGFEEEDKVVAILVDPSTGSQWGKTLADSVADNLRKKIKEYISILSPDNIDVTEVEEEIKGIIKESIKEGASGISNMTITTVGDISLHIAITLWIGEKIITFAAGKVSIYKVENHQLKALYLLMDKPPIKINITGQITKFNLSINSFDETKGLSSIIVASDGFYPFLKDPKIHNLISRIDSPTSILSKLDEYLTSRTPDDNASIIMLWKEELTKEEASKGIYEKEIATVSAVAAEEALTSHKKLPDDYYKTYNKTTIEKLTETLRNIQETEIGKEMAKKEKNKKARKPSKLLYQPITKREISPTFAIIIVLLFLLLFGGFLYLKYGHTITSYFSHSQGTTSTSSTTNNTETSSSSSQSSSNVATATKTETSSTEEVATATTAEESTTTETSSETTVSNETNEETTVNTVNVQTITKPSGLLVVLIQTDEWGRQKAVIDRCKSPCTMNVPENIENPMFVAMYQGAICASYPKASGTPWSLTDIKTPVIMDCREIAEDNPEKPILITSSPSNIRIRIFHGNSEIYTALSPFRIPVMGNETDEIIIRAYIKGKQCAAYKGTWKDILDKKHIHLVCQE